MKINMPIICSDWKHTLYQFVLVLYVYLIAHYWNMECGWGFDYEVLKDLIQVALTLPLFVALFCFQVFLIIDRGEKYRWYLVSGIINVARFNVLSAVTCKCVLIEMKNPVSMILVALTVISVCVLLWNYIEYVMDKWNIGIISQMCLELFLASWIAV